MKNLFLLMALILTFAEFNAVAHGADRFQSATAMATQHADCSVG